MSKEVDKRSNAGSPTKSAKSLPRTPDTPSSTAQDKKSKYFLFRIRSIFISRRKNLTYVINTKVLGYYILISLPLVLSFHINIIASLLHRWEIGLNAIERIRVRTMFKKSYYINATCVQTILCLLILQRCRWIKFKLALHPPRTWRLYDRRSVP